MVFKRTILLASAAILALAGLSPQNTHAAVTAATALKAGDLIRGESFAAVYYLGQDGFRYVFPNDKTFSSWYANFDGVKFLSDKDLAAIQIRGNVTYRPGTRMIKINSDPKTYAVDENGTLRWITSEAVAVALYGGDWNKKIDDVPDAFFGNYRIGEQIDAASQFAVTQIRERATSINEDKDLKSAFVVEMRNNAYSPLNITIDAGRAVRFVNRDSVKHTATAQDVSWGTGTLEPGQSFSRYFSTPGTYPFFCSYHSSTMMGTITVQ